MVSLNDLDAQLAALGSDASEAASSSEGEGSEGGQAAPVLEKDDYQ